MCPHPDYSFSHDCPSICLSTYLFLHQLADLLLLPLYNHLLLFHEYHVPLHPQFPLKLFDGVLESGMR